VGAKTRSVFWDELEKELADPEFRQQFILERNRVETVDRVMNLIIDALDDSGLSRADVARAIGSHSSAVRRLLSVEAGPVNPTLRTLSDVAAVLGFQVELVPMTPETRRDVSDQLINGAPVGSRAVAPTRRQRKPTTAA
jgi:ribosome-binding protein aMBF1 (putative translation factor)